MNSKQKKKIIKVIKKDCTLGGRYVSDNPKSGDACVIGGLALAAGVSHRRLKKAGAEPIYMDDLAWLRIVLADEYGLSKMHVEELQHANDKIEADGTTGETTKSRIKDRREALINVVEEWDLDDEE